MGRVASKEPISFGMGAVCGGGCGGDQYVSLFFNESTSICFILYLFRFLFVSFSLLPLYRGSQPRDIYLIIYYLMVYYLIVYYLIVYYSFFSFP
jgi:hypothetical protein